MHTTPSRPIAKRQAREIQTHSALLLVALVLAVLVGTVTTIRLGPISAKTDFISMTGP